MSLNKTFIRTEVVNEDEALRCINKAIEIDEKDLDYTLSKALIIRALIREYLIKYFDNQRSKKIILYNNQKERKNLYFSIVYCMIFLFFVHN